MMNPKEGVGVTWRREIASDEAGRGIVVCWPTRRAATSAAFQVQDLGDPFGVLKGATWADTFTAK